MPDKPPKDKTPDTRITVKPSGLAVVTKQPTRSRRYDMSGPYK